MRARSVLRRLSISPRDAVVPASPQVPLRTIFRRFWPDARPYRRLLAVSLVFIALVPAIQTVETGLFKVVVDRVLVPRHFGPFLWLALAFLGLAIADGVVSFVDNVLSTWIGERFLLSLRTRLFRHIQELSLDFFERRRLGDILSRLTSDIAAIENLVLSGVASALSNALTIVFFTVALFYLRWDLALVSLVVVPLFWLIARRFAQRIKQASREKRRRSGSITAVAEESLANIQLVQAYNRQAAEALRFHRENVGSFQAQLASTKLRALFGPVVGLIDVAGAVIVIGAGSWELSRGRMTLGALFAFLAFLGRLYAPARALGSLSSTAYSASASAERIIELLDERRAVVERATARTPVRVQGAVELDGVSFRYPGAQHDALREVSFRVRSGEMVALVGASGAGKSTIAKLLLRFYDPTEGAVLLDGEDVRGLRLHAVRDAIAVLLQDTLVFDGTVRENIAFGRPRATRAQIAAAARAANAHEFVAALPAGYETQIGTGGRRLSGGQRQRIAIARAMLRDSPVLILDEPTTGLDAEGAQRILEPLRRLMRGRSTIVISHNLLTVRDATTIVVLDGGRVVERGTHAELVERAGTYAQLYALHEPEAALS